jgi:O-methyltransferase involved in polyketide biosynthesis
VAEGLMYYLTEEQIKALLERTVERFPSGQIMFDAVSRLYLKIQKTNVGISATGARMVWGIDDPHEMESRSPRIELVTKLSSMDQDLPNIKRLPEGRRLLIRGLAHIRALREKCCCVTGFEHLMTKSNNSCCWGSKAGRLWNPLPKARVEECRSF